MRKIIMSIIIAGTLFSCSDATKSDATKQKGIAEIIGKSEFKAESGIMSPEALYSFGRVGAYVVSPDKSKILYQVTYVGIEENKTNSELFVMNIDGTDKKQLTVTAANERNPQWIENGEKIAFLSSESGSSQIWTMNPDGSGMKRISDIDGGIDGFIFSPNGEKLLFHKSVKVNKTTVDNYPDLPENTGRVVDDLMYKHWDTWVDEIPHTFIADISGNKITNIKDLLEGEPYQAPVMPFGGIDQLAWHPDGNKVVYTSKRKVGREFAESTNIDIFMYDIESGETKNMTEGMMGYDMSPQFSDDGKYLAWQSMERDGYEADKNRLFVLDLATGEKKYITENYDNNVDAFAWNNDNKTIYFVTSTKGTVQLYSANIESLEINAITEGKHDYTSVALGNGNLIAGRQSMSKPTELFAVNIETGEATELTFENKHLLDQITMGEVEERWIATTDGKEMLTWVVYPPNFDATKQYPALLYCQGGPQNMVSQFWSYRWNPQTMAANGYIVVMPNRRGLPGFGQEWNEQISGDYGGQNMKDYLAAIDALAKEPFIDENRLGCTGASYGGFSVFWLAGNHNKRFKAFFAHAGIFNLEAQYLETEEMFFANWDMGGSYWDKANRTAQGTFANSPHRFVDRWDTPIMISHGELDYRILASQGMMAFNAAKLRDIPARMLIFPDENHWITQPQNGILFQREFFRWFDEWLK